MRSGGRLQPFTWEPVTEEGQHNAEQPVHGTAAVPLGVVYHEAYFSCTMYSGHLICNSHVAASLLQP